MDGIHVYTAPNVPGVALCCGVRPGRERPELWVLSPTHGTTVVASFHSAESVDVFVTLMDNMVNQINRTIQHYADKHGDPTG